MLIKKKTGLEIPSSEITPEQLYLSRRQFIKGATVAAAGLTLAACAPGADNAPRGAAPAPLESVTPGTVSGTADELGDALNDFQDIISYNNYYEFSLDKDNVAENATSFVTEPWSVAVSGMVNNPQTFDLEDLLAFEQEERIYRLRCVEAWSMVIPWLGFPLRKLLESSGTDRQTPNTCVSRR